VDRSFIFLREVCTIRPVNVRYNMQKMVEQFNTRSGRRDTVAQGLTDVGKGICAARDEGYSVLVAQ
jgi:hypothetical protein